MVTPSASSCAGGQAGLDRSGRSLLRVAWIVSRDAEERQNPARPTTASAGFAIHSAQRMSDPRKTAPGINVSEVGPQQAEDVTEL